MLDKITVIAIYASLTGLFVFGLDCFLVFVTDVIKIIVDAVKWVVGKFKPEETDCYHCKYYDIANYWCNKHEDGRLMQESCKDGRRG